MKRVIFKEYRQYGALICGIFLVAGGIFMIILLGPHLSTVRLSVCIDTIIVQGLFLAIGLANIFYGYVYSKTGIKEIIINASNILITAYNEETKKEYTLNLPISEILSCHVNISYTKDYNKVPSRYDRMDILIDFNIECADGVNHQIVFHTGDYHKIKQIFSVAKYFPNFSYKVDTNAEECEQNIINLSQTGKNLSLKQYFSTYFANPKIPSWQKIYLKILFVIIILLSCFLIYAVQDIIKDLLRF